MSKKKAGKAKPAAKAAKRAKVVPMKAKAAKKATNGSGKPAPARKPGPRSQVLPGMEQVRNRSLDRLCENLGETRDELARIIGEQDGLQASAMATMQRDGVTAYRHAGIELALVPGGAKLRVRKLKDKTAQSASQAAPEAEETEAEEGATADEMGGEAVEGNGLEGPFDDAGDDL